MPFPSPLSASEQTNKRSKLYSAIRYVAYNSPVVQFQFNPTANASGTSAAQISFNSSLQGSADNLLIGMTVYITPTSDYASDLINQPENCLKTYVRKAPTASILYIGWTAFQWTTSSVVTVVSNFEIHSKKTRLAGSAKSPTIYKDVDVSYRKPLPRIYGLYADVIMTTTTSASVSPTPSEEAMASGASISSRTWATIENGVVTKAVSTSATPTFTLDLGVHWLHLTTTDSNGNSNWFAMLVAVVPEDYSSVVTKLLAGRVTNDLNAGIRADIATISDTSALIPGTAGIVFDDINYQNGYREWVVKAFGWFDAESSQFLVGDANTGITVELNTALVGAREVANEAVKLPAFPFAFANSPNEWGEVARCTVYDAIWYAISEHSTLGNLASVEFPVSYTNYQFNPSIAIPEGALFDSIDTLAFFASGGMCNHSPNGELVFEQSLIYATADATRNAANVFATYSTSDLNNLQPTRPPVNKFPLSAIQAGFATWNTTTNTARVYNSIAPADDSPAALLETLDGIIMAKNLSDANARIEAGKLTANHFFASVPSLTITADFWAGYTVIEAASHIWHKFSVAASELLDGAYFDSNTRFLCVSVDSTYLENQWSITTSAQFREETNGANNYARETIFVPLGTESPIPTYPAGDFSPYLDDYGTPSDYYGLGQQSYRQGWEDPTLPPDTGAENKHPDAGVIETIYVPFKGGQVSSSFNTSLSTDYLLRIRGIAKISDIWSKTFDFLNNGAEGFTLFDTIPAIAGDQLGGVVGNGWETSLVQALISGSSYQSLQVVRAGISFPGAFTLERVKMTGSLPILGLATTGGFQRNAYGLDFRESGITVYSNTAAAIAAYLTVTEIDEIVTPITVDEVRFSSYMGSVTTIGPSDPGGYHEIHTLTIYGSGSNPFTGTEDASLFADAFYSILENEATAFNTGEGLLLDGADFPSRPAYSADNSYEFVHAGTGNPILLEFLDPDGDYSDNENKGIFVDVIPI